MPVRILRNEFALAVPARAVFDHVRDPRSYVGLSPLVVAVSDIEVEGDGWRYHAVERVPIIGRWTIDNHLRVTLFGEESSASSASASSASASSASASPASASPAAGHRTDASAAFVVHGEVASPGAIHVDYRYDITPIDGGCRVVDVVSLRTPFGLAGFAASRARQVQLSRPATLANRLTPPA